MPGFLTDLISDIGHASFNPENYRNKPVYDANNNITGFIDSEGNPTNNPMSRPGVGIRLLAPSDTANLYKFNQDYAAAPVNSAQQREMATKAFQNDTSNTMGRMGTYGGATGNAQRGLYGTGLMDPSKIKAGNELGAEEAISNFYNTQARGSDFANTNALNFNKSLNEQGVPEAEATSKKATAQAATAQAGAQIDEAALAQIAAQYKMTPEMQSILKDTLKQTGVNALAGARLVDDPASGHLFLNTYDPATGATTRTDLGLRPSASTMERLTAGESPDQTVTLPGGGAVRLPRSTTVGGDTRDVPPPARAAAPTRSPVTSPYSQPVETKGALGRAGRALYSYLEDQALMENPQGEQGLEHAIKPFGVAKRYLFGGIAPETLNPSARKPIDQAQLEAYRRYLGR